MAVVFGFEKVMALFAIEFPKVFTRFVCIFGYV